MQLVRACPAQIQEGEPVAYHSHAPGRIGQSAYWLRFCAYMVLVPVLLVFGVYQLFKGNFGTGVLAVLLIAPAGLYFRVVMMRRCRDIGWPAFLPWLSFGLQMAIGVFGQVRLVGGGLPSASLLMLPLAASLADFVFSIVIGCIASKERDDYAAVFDFDDRDIRRAAPLAASHRPHAQPRQAMADGPDLDRFDAAIARALEAQRSGADSSSLAAAAPAAARPAPSFGRKIV
jgi:uncharacterized membrane protein YhaH (DUF805 family)